MAPELVELGNLAVVGERILMAALQRRESRGAHYRADFPTRRPADPTPAPGDPTGMPTGLEVPSTKHNIRGRSRSLVPAASLPPRDSAGKGANGQYKSRPQGPAQR